jgi:hypothetical protein
MLTPSKIYAVKTIHPQINLRSTTSLLLQEKVSASSGRMRLIAMRHFSSPQERMSCEAGKVRLPAKHHFHPPSEEGVSPWRTDEVSLPESLLTRNEPTNLHKVRGQSSYYILKLYLQ